MNIHLSTGFFIYDHFQFFKMPGPKKYPSAKTIAKEVLKTLEELYPETPIPLQHEDSYTLLIAVLLSAQCTDERVNKITPLLFARANNPADMIKLEVKEIESIKK